jgi:hypothetical protein
MQLASPRRGDCETQNQIEEESPGRLKRNCFPPYPSSLPIPNCFHAFPIHKYPHPLSVIAILPAPMRLINGGRQDLGSPMAFVVSSSTALGKSQLLVFGIGRESINFNSLGDVHMLYPSVFEKQMRCTCSRSALGTGW